MVPSSHSSHPTFSYTDDIAATWTDLILLLGRVFLGWLFLAAGYGTVDVEACSKAGIIVVNQAGMNAGAVAEHTLGMMLSLSKRRDRQPPPLQHPLLALELRPLRCSGRF